MIIDIYIYTVTTIDSPSLATVRLSRVERSSTMARRFKKTCDYPMCNNLTYDRYCKKHASLNHEQRANASQRGYNYRWQKYRKSFLMKHPFCESCLKRGQITNATVVDHIVPHKGNYRLFWDESNHQALCATCHNRKTATEDMASWDTNQGLR